MPVDTGSVSHPAGGSYIGHWVGRFIWTECDPDPYHFFLMARRAFRLHGRPSSATLHVTADDRYALYINGQVLGQRPGAGRGLLESPTIATTSLRTSTTAAMLSPSSHITTAATTPVPATTAATGSSLSSSTPRPTGASRSSSPTTPGASSALGGGTAELDAAASGSTRSTTPTSIRRDGSSRASMIRHGTPLVCSRSKVPGPSAVGDIWSRGASLDSLQACPRRLP